jgi:hypothetical protein
MPEDGIDRLRDHDAIFLGAVGFPGVPDHVSLWGLLIPIRRQFDQYVNPRPCDCSRESNRRFAIAIPVISIFGSSAKIRKVSTPKSAAARMPERSMKQSYRKRYSRGGVRIVSCATPSILRQLSQFPVALLFRFLR